MNRFPFCLLAAALSFPVWAQVPDPGIVDREFQRQMEAERQRREQMEPPAPSIHLQQEETPSLTYPEAETPCQPIHGITLEGDTAEDFQWALYAAEDAVGRCLGGEGISVAMSKIQNAIIDKGYVTTRVLAAPQDLSTGILRLTLMVGRVGQIKFAEGSRWGVQLGPNIPIRSGEILNLRDLEQGLENLHRVPTATSDVKITPGQKEGESDLVVEWQQPYPLRLSLAFDDSGSDNTGKYQGTATVSYDNPLGLSDLFYVSIGHSLEHSKPYGTRNHSLYYSIPFGYNMVTVTASDYTYHQTVAGYMDDYVYSGDSRNVGFEFSRIIHRTAKSKTSASIGTWFSKQHNFIDGEQIDVQRRRTAGWEAGLTHEQFFKHASLNADLKVKRGTGIFAAERAPEELFDEGTSRATIITTNIRLAVPMTLGDYNFRYTSTWRQQMARNRLTARDRFSIGGRHTVRGYDGEYSLSADNGIVWRNELGWQFNIGDSRHEFYVAYDAGHVHGPFDEYLLGRTLTGMAQGLRGSVKNLSYEVFMAQPLSHPKGYPADGMVTGFNLSLAF